MTPMFPRRTVTFLAALALAACSSARPADSSTAPQPARSARQANPADVRFMTGMIGHHAQAIVMARLAPTHDASPSVKTLAARIINAQLDEITAMQQWLRDHGQPVPAPDTSGIHATGGHAGHAMMPGMLTHEQLMQLDAAKGREFDRLFLVNMIQHHRGAVTMVKELMGSQGAALDDTVFKLASDVNVDQETEIARMEQMLVAIVIEGRSP